MREIFISTLLLVTAYANAQTDTINTAKNNDKPWHLLQSVAQTANNTAKNNTAAATTTATAAVTTAATATVKWYTMEEAQALNAKAPRKIFIDMYTGWCGWCKVLDKNTFSNPEIAKYLNTYFYPVKFNAEGKDPVVFNGQTFTLNPPQKFHDLAIAIMQGKMNFPTMVFINDNLQLLTMVQSYLPPEDLQPILIFFAHNYYQTLNWPDFQQQLPEIMKTLPQKN
jgi:thioredoxin-related protein